MEAISCRIGRKLCALLCLIALASGPAHGEDGTGANIRGESTSMVFKDSLEFPSDGSSEIFSPDAAKFDKWEPLVEREPLADNLAKWSDPSVKTVDWLRHFGLRHSSSDGRYIGRGVPLEGSSWLNRPFHADWFMGILLGDDMTQTVNLENEVFAGVRIGYDFDYYWGLGWRFGWSNPDIEVEHDSDADANGSYFISDINLKYYPWGDAKVRPYWLMGMGLARIEYTNLSDVSENATLATMPLGVGVEFPQFPWLAWRLEVLDNLAFGANGVETLNNFSLTAGMEWRFGAKPNSYWPWRASRKIW